MVIQRSWKILSEVGATSTTDANYSPTRHFSSDDSNCSNQTAHSMVTSIRSNKIFIETVVGSTTGYTTSSSSLSGTIAATTKAEMKFVTTPQVAENTLQRLRQRLVGNTTVAGGCSNNESAMRSLELLRISVQQAFDKEVNEIIKRFMENYFKPAFCNIKENLGQNAVNEEMLQKMSCALLENSKNQYHTLRTRNQLAINTFNDDSAARMAIKRPATNSIYELNNKIHMGPTLQPQEPQLQQQTLLMPIKSALQQAAKAITLQCPNTFTNVPVRRQIFWNTAQITTNTHFVIDVHANITFGFDVDGKVRLANKHPELIRYLADAEDCNWLVAQNIVLQQNRNSRILFLLYDEVCRLQQTNDLYRNIDVNLLLTFTLPESIVNKMQRFFYNLNKHSGILVTNSFPPASILSNPQSNSHLRNALLQGLQGTMQNANVIAINSCKEMQATKTITECCKSNMQIISTTNVKPKAASSTLSSSHATLTALLNNSAGNSQQYQQHQHH